MISKCDGVNCKDVREVRLYAPSKNGAFILCRGCFEGVMKLWEKRNAEEGTNFPIENWDDLVIWEQ